MSNNTMQPLEFVKDNPLPGYWTASTPFGYVTIVADEFGYEWRTFFEGEQVNSFEVESFEVAKQNLESIVRRKLLGTPQ